MIRDNADKYLTTLKEDASFYSTAKCLSVFDMEEQKKDKSIIDFTDEEIREIISSKFGVSISNMSLYRNALNRYLVWLGDNGYGKRAKIKIFIAPNETTKNVMVSSARSLVDMMDSFLDAEEKKTVDLLIRACLELAFIGFKQRDIFSAEKTQFDFTEMCVRKDASIFPIPKEFFFSLYNCVALDSLNVYSDNKIIQSKRHDSPYLLSGVKSVWNYTTFKKILRERTEKSKYKPTLIAIRKSGFFAREYELEQRTKMYPNFTAMAHDYHDNDDGIVRKARFLREDYYIWKETFELSEIEDW